MKHSAGVFSSEAALGDTAHRWPYAAVRRDYLDFAVASESPNNKLMFADVCGCLVSKSTKGTEEAAEFEMFSFEIC